ncbi:MAG: DHA2 family efflux MFS transporter permease subunit [Acidobacteria bacterium]|nr:DHA2 family efflux MFS transporter permease subunit [Acidobacteriota bacterium]
MSDRELGSHPAADPQEWRPSHNPWIIAGSVMLATFMEVLDTSVANVALPHIAGNLSVTTEEATWVLTSYLISNAIILPASGWLSSFFGRKRFLMTCVVIFTLSSFVCGAALSLGMLVFARVVQGVGGGALQPIAQSVLLESFPPAKRGVAMAVFGMGVVVAPIIGPTLGGWVTDNYSWRWVFYINLPVGVLAILMTQAFVEDPPYIKAGARRTIDYLGFGLMTLWLGTLQLIFDKGQQEDWFAAVWIRWFAVISCACMVAFIIRELRAREPIVDLRVFANRNFAVGTFLMTIVGAVLYSTMASLPLFLQTLLGYPAKESGMAVSPRGLGAMVSLNIVGRLIGRIDSRFLIVVGLAILGVSTFLLGNVNLEIAMDSVVWPNIISGFAMGFIFVPLTTLSMGTLRNEQMGNAAGLYNLMRNIGGSVGISVATTMIFRSGQMHQATLVSHLTPYDPAFQQRLHAIQEGLSSQVGPLAAAQQAYAVIYGILVRQARLMAFVDSFRWLALMCLLCLPLVLLFKKSKPRAGGVPAR